MMSSNNIQGKVVLITGASSGIGRACALSFARYHPKIILVARRIVELESLKSELQNMYPGIDIHAQGLDITQKDQVDDFFNTLPESFKNIDILINNAGCALGLEHTVAADIDDWENMININLKGFLYIIRQVLQTMYKNQRGHIINIGSIAGEFPYANASVYCATKAAVHAFSRALREECIEYNVKVSEVMPGAVNTEFSKVRFKGNTDKADNVYNGFDPLLASDVADLIFYIANLPKHVNLAESIIMPSAQASVHKIHRSL